MAYTYTLGTEVTLIWTTDESPHLLKATLSYANGEVVDVDVLNQGSEVAEVPDVGTRVIVCLEEPEKMKVTAKVGSIDGGKLRLIANSYLHFSRRDYPRVDTHLGLIFRMDSAGKNALNVGQLAALKAWVRPSNPDINFAVSGLAFMSVLAYPIGSILELRITLPGDNDEGPTFELKGEVVRSNRDHTDSERDGMAEPELDELGNSPLDSVEGGHHIAVQLMDLDVKTTEALTAFTLSVQDEVLEVKPEV